MKKRLAQEAKKAKKAELAKAERLKVAKRVKKHAGLHLAQKPKARKTHRYKAKTSKVEVDVNVHTRVAHNAKVNPDHYARASRSGQQIIDVLEDFGVQNNAYRFVTVQYLFRAGRKSSETVTDLLKARWYIDREIAHLQRGRKAS
jgi:hypothetical protein